MKVKVNGQEKEVGQNVSAANFLSSIGFDKNSGVVECNLKILKTEELDKVVLKDGDSLEVLRFVGGG
ncbi:MAG: sulfur carrier protein ThiS [Elusimicrobiota bacterium]|jgi:sulfur carrier protein|nr:sulfur carrier protein ThiS [Elusimicrobiota bacterium]